MATQFEIDCALMAGASYISTRPLEENKLPTPNGWQRYTDWPADPITGFEAITFTNGSEYVIAFARIKGVSFALLLEQPCHDAHALN